MRLRRLPLLAILLGTAFLAVAGPAAAATGPLYDVKATWGDTNLGARGDEGELGEGQLAIQVRNIGDQTGAAPLTITDQLPPAATITAIAWLGQSDLDLSSLCTGVGTAALSCTMPASDLPTYAPAPGVRAIGSGFGGEHGFDLKPSGYLPKLFVDVAVAPGAAGTQTNTATVSGGGAASPASDVDQVPLGGAPSPFGIVPGSFEAGLFDAAYPFGARPHQAGAHPFELRVDFDLNQGRGSTAPEGAAAAATSSPTA